MGLLSVLFLIIFLSYVCWNLVIMAQHLWGIYQLKVKSGDKPSDKAHIAVEFPPFAHPRQNIDISISFTIPEAIGIKPKRNTRIVFVIDHSAGMFGENQRQANWGAVSILERCGFDGDSLKVAIVAMASQTQLISDFSNDRQALIELTKTAVPPSQGKQNIAQALLTVKSLFESQANENEQIDNIVILFTDAQGEVIVNEGDERIKTLFSAKRQKLFSLRVGRHQEKDNAEDPLQAQLFNRFACNGQGVGELLQQAFDENDIGADSCFVEFDLVRDHDIRFLATRSNHYMEGFTPLIWNCAASSDNAQVVKFSITAPERWGLFSLSKSPVKVTVVKGDVNTPKLAVKNAAIMITPAGPSILWALLINPYLMKFVQKYLNRLTLNKEQITRAFSLKAPKPSDVAHFKQPKVEYQQLFEPCFCIALGGSGIQTALRVQSFCSDLNGGYYPDDVLKFLYIDTDTNIQSQMAFGGSDISRAEYLNIGSDLWPRHQELVNNPELLDWYPGHWNTPLDRSFFDTRNGCNRNRLLGRLSLEQFNHNSSDVMNKRLDEGIEWLKSKKERYGDKVKLVVVTGTSGGTGSAIFADMIERILFRLQNAGGDLDHQQVIAVLNDLSPCEPSHFADRQQYYRANHWAFLLELERLKKTVNFPKVINNSETIKTIQELKNPRFTEIEFLTSIQAHNAETALNSSAGLITAMITSQGEFKAELNKNCYEKTLANNRLIHFALNSQILPMTLLRRYVTDALSLSLLETVTGMKQVAGKFVCQIDSEDERIEQMIDFLLRSTDVDDFDKLTTPAPMLFKRVKELSVKTEDADPLEQVVGTLSSCEPYLEQGSIESHRLAASRRIMEWVYAILNHSDKTQSLALVITCLEKIETMMFYAMEQVRLTELHLEMRDEQVIYFSEDRLQQVWLLLGHYQQTVHQVQNWLNQWVYALSESFPPQCAMTPAPADDFVGLMRRVYRKLALVELRLKDYAPLVEQNSIESLLIMAKHQVNVSRETIGDEGWQALVDCIFWRYDQRLTDFAKGDVSIISTINPFIFSMQDIQEQEVNLLVHGDEQKSLMETLNLLIESVLPPLKLDELILKAATEPDLTLREQMQYRFSLDNEHGEHKEFALPVARMAMVSGSNEQFRKLANYEKELKQPNLARGVRQHITTADIHANAIQKAAMVYQPMNALIVPLLAELMQLQKFIYLCLEGLVKLDVNEQGYKIWCVKYSSRGTFDWYQIGERESEEHFVRAAWQFVCVGKPTTQSEPFDADKNWCPTDEDISRLKDWKVSRLVISEQAIDTFLHHCEAVLELMSEQKEGYIDISALHTHDYPMETSGV